MPETPIAFSDEQMSALLAASCPLPPDCRSAFLEHCARELSRLPEIGDGALHRIVMQVQRFYFHPPIVEQHGRMRGMGKYAR